MISFNGKGNCVRFAWVGQSNVAKLTVASDTYADGQKLRTDFVQLTIFGDKAALVEAALGRGDWIEFEGEVRTRTVGEGEDARTFTDMVMTGYVLKHSKAVAPVEAPAPAKASKAKAKAKAPAKAKSKRAA